MDRLRREYLKSLDRIIEMTKAYREALENLKYACQQHAKLLAQLERAETRASEAQRLELLEAP